jgi:glycosyltransferase involved in cell wall biosynthesis
MRAVYVSPLPPEPSGIADYSALLLPALRERLDVTTVRRGRRLPRGVDTVLYHVGNDVEAHGWIVRLLERRRGIVVLHDFVLHHLMAGLTVGRGDGDAYLRLLQADGGIAARLLGHGVLDGSIPPLWETRPQDFPLVDSILARADGVIVHSSYVARSLRMRMYSGPIWQIPHPAWEPPPPRPIPLPSRGRVVIGCFGHLNASKRTPQLLEAVARLRSRGRAVLLLLAGAVAPGMEVEQRAARVGLELGRDLLLLGRASEDRLWDLIHACDVCVTLRYPTMGETSGIAIRALSAGKPLVVSDHGWFAELPSGVAAKVPVDRWEVDMVTAILDRLCLDVALRDRLGRAALEYARQEHGLERVADLYTTALEEAAGGEAVRAEVARQLAERLYDVGVRSADSEVALVGAHLSELGLG